MGKTNYYYNPETCQYERVRTTFWNVLWYCAGVIAVGSLLFAGLFLLTDRFTATDQEKWLLAENEALAKHQIILASQLTQVESTLSHLYDMDKVIHEKLFEEKLSKNNTDNRERTNSYNIFQADEDHFNLMLEHVSDMTGNLVHKSARINAAFGAHFEMSQEDISLLQNIPTHQPIRDPDISWVVSGYGVRINPFHKGKYMHPGIDFAAPRGTEVLVAAPGTVSLVNRSALQAGYGNYVEVNHGNGFVTRYAHLENIHVKQGQKVEKGKVIGTVGSSGGSIAPHLHYEILQQGENVDPLIYMVEELTSKQYNQLITICNKQNQSLD